MVVECGQKKHTEMELSDYKLRHIFPFSCYANLGVLKIDGEKMQSFDCNEAKFCHG